MGQVKAVIPAAGLGTRLYPATKSQPKEMLPLGTKPTIQLVAEELVGAGLKEILIITGRQKRAIEDHFDPGDGLACEGISEPGDLFDDGSVRFFYTRQSRPRGLGDAVAHAREFVGDSQFAVALGDSVILGDGGESLLQRMLRVHGECGAAGTIAVQEVPLEATRKYGILAVEQCAASDALRVVGIVEKPGPEHAPSQLAVCARYIFAPELFDFLAQTPPGRGGELQLTDAIQAMVAAGRSVYAVPLRSTECRLDVGDFDSYARAFMRVMLTHPELGPGLREYVRGVIGAAG